MRDTNSTCPSFASAAAAARQGGAVSRSSCTAQGRAFICLSGGPVCDESVPRAPQDQACFTGANTSERMLVGRGEIQAGCTSALTAAVGKGPRRSPALLGTSPRE
ncbi:unnamed protein product [Merluccius merluccius]